MILPDIHPVVAGILRQRGFLKSEDCELFLHGTLAHLPNPFGLSGMEPAIARVLQAIIKEEPVLFFGDYDVDGITGTAQALAFFQEIGARAEGLLPLRMEDGYGLTESSVRKIIQRHPALVVTIDNGTTARKELEDLRRAGIDIIVIDHHETPSASSHSPALAIINPKAENPAFPERNIASAGLVFLFLMALRSRLRDRGIAPLPNLKRYLDLAALGTIADIVPMTGTNRLIVKYGLQELGSTSRPGLRALMDKASVTAPINVGHVGFRIAPRINASGRLADPRLALDLLLSRSLEDAEPLAAQLDDLNRERQRVEEEVLKDAMRQVEEHQKDRKGLAVAGRGWHMGVVGIVASRLTEHFGKPAIVLSLSPDGREARGSARTVPGISVYEALKTMEHEMLRFGGHDAAAGMTVAGDAIDRFALSFDQAVCALWKEDHQPKLWIDSELSLKEASRKLVDDLQLLEPHGPGNPQPTFLSTSILIQAPRLVGNSHLKMVLKQDEAALDAIGFGLGAYLESALHASHHDVVYNLELNEWNGRTSIQPRVRAARMSSKNNIA